MKLQPVWQAGFNVKEVYHVSPNKNTWSTFDHREQ